MEKLTIRIIRDLKVYGTSYPAGTILQDGTKARFFKSPPRLAKTANGYKHALHFIPAEYAEEISEKEATTATNNPPAHPREDRQEKTTMDAATQNTTSDNPTLFDLPGLSEPVTAAEPRETGHTFTKAKIIPTRAGVIAEPIAEAPRAANAEKWQGLNEIDPAEKAQKWTNASGPRKAKPTIKLLQELRWTARELVEITGTRPDTRHAVIASLCGEKKNIIAEQLYIFIGKKYGWTITDGNRAELETDLKEAIQAAQEARPVEDNSISAEEARELAAARDQARREQEAEREREKEEKESMKADPISPRSGARLVTADERPKMSSYALAALNIKRELAKKWPGIDFRTRCQGYSGGSSIYISWTDGPSGDDAGEIIDWYQAGIFDPSNDLYSYRRESGHSVYGSARYTSAQREVSFLDELSADIAERENRENDDSGDHWSPKQQARRIAARASLKANERYSGIERDDSPEQWRITKEKTGPDPTEQADEEEGAAGARVTVRHNTEKNGIEIYFTAKPDPATLDEIKAQRYRWSRRRKMWYTKYSAEKLDRARAMAERINGQQTDTQPPAAEQRGIM